MILRQQYKESDDTSQVFESPQQSPSFKRNGLVDLFLHPLNDCKDIVDDDLYSLLIDSTHWLDIEAFNDIKYMLTNCVDSQLYIISLVHRLEQVAGKIEMSVIRYDYKSLKSLSTIISRFIIQRIDSQDVVDICPSALINHINLLGEKERYFSCKLPIIKLPSGKKSILLNKLKCERWWFRKLNKKINQERELLKIAIGVVCFKNQAYASNETVNAYTRKVEAEKKYLSTLSFKCKNTGVNICLSDLKSSDQRRFSEFIVTSKGIEKRAKSLGLIASLLTLTLPSQYHPNPENGDSSLWQGYTPEDGYNQLTCLTNRFNKMIHKAGLYDNSGYYSIRAIEIHHDATPHFHVLIFYRPEYKSIIKNAIRYQFSDDYFSDKSKGYNWIDINESKSSPVYYLCKQFTCSNGDEKSKENIRISANKYIWNIKSFELTGLPGGTKTLWKNLRKSKADIGLNAVEKKLQKLAVSNDFYKFIEILEQPNILIKISYKTKLSRYGEDVRTVSGVSVAENKIQHAKESRFIYKKN